MERPAADPGGPALRQHAAERPGCLPLQWRRLRRAALALHQPGGRPHVEAVAALEPARQRGTRLRVTHVGRVGLPTRWQRRPQHHAAAADEPATGNRQQVARPGHGPGGHAVPHRHRRRDRHPEQRRGPAILPERGPHAAHRGRAGRGLAHAPGMAQLAGPHLAGGRVPRCLPGLRRHPLRGAHGAGERGQPHRRHATDQRLWRAGLARCGRCTLGSRRGMAWW